MTEKIKQFNFTKKEILDLPTQVKRYRCNDPKTRGLFIEVMPSGEKFFRVRGKVNGKDASVTLGRFPDITREQARVKAAENRNLMASGINPNQLKQAHSNEQVTLEEVYLNYISSRELRPRSIANYKQNLDCYLDKWRRKPLKALDEETIKKIHSSITETSKAQADQTMRFLRAIFNFAKSEYRGLNNEYIFSENPVQIINDQRLWHHVPRKQTRLHDDELRKWFQVVSDTREEAVRCVEPFTVAVCDVLVMAVLTGLRKSEILELTWDRVNLRRKSFFISKTKNGLPLELPITSAISDIFQRRDELKTDSPYVFNVPNAKGRIIEPKKVITKIGLKSETHFGFHDLRRTFASTGERLNVGIYTLRRLMNHKAKQGDVTEGYVIQTAEELREPSQRIGDHILLVAGLLRQEKPNLDQQLNQALENLDDEAKSKLLEELLLKVV